MHGPLHWAKIDGHKFLEAMALGQQGVNPDEQLVEGLRRLVALRNNLLDAAGGPAIKQQAKLIDMWADAFSRAILCLMHGEQVNANIFQAAAGQVNRTLMVVGGMR